MKKIIQSRIFLVIICGILFTSFGIYATNYLASDISYAKDGVQTNVKDALDDLYGITTLGDATVEDIASGKTAIVKGELLTGTAVNGTNFEFEKIYSNTIAQSGTTSLKVELSYTLEQDYEYILINTARSFFRIPANSTTPNSFSITEGAYSLTVSSSELPIYENGAIKIYKNLKAGTTITANNYVSANSGMNLWLALMMSIYKI